MANNGVMTNRHCWNLAEYMDFCLTPTLKVYDGGERVGRRGNAYAGEWKMEGNEIELIGFRAMVSVPAHGFGVLHSSIILPAPESYVTFAVLSASFCYWALCKP